MASSLSLFRQLVRPGLLRLNVLPTSSSSLRCCGYHHLNLVNTLRSGTIALPNIFEKSSHPKSNVPMGQLVNGIQKMIVRGAHKPPLTYDYIRERIMLVLRLYDKIDPDQLKLDSHFTKDLGLDSLDHVELIMAIEDEFQFEIPDQDAEKLNTPNDILKYISIKEEIYPELEHRDDHHGGGEGDHAHH